MGWFKSAEEKEAEAAAKKAAENAAKKTTYYYDDVSEGMGGQKKCEGLCKDGEKDGKWTYWSPDGKESTEFTWKNGKEWDGFDTTWDYSGQKKKETPYKNGKKDGLETTWVVGEISEVTTWKNGKKDGLRTVWHIDVDENGQKWYEETYKDGIQIGKYESWSEDGIKEWEYYYNDDGTRDSTKLTTRWYESGQKWFEGYKKTLDDTTSVWIGLRTTWYENGRKSSEETYKDGKLISEVHYLKESILNLLKDKSIKMTISDITAHIKHDDRDEVKSLLEKMHNDGEIDFAGSGRYFIYSEKKKESKKTTPKTKEVDIEKELEKYKGLLDKGLIDKEDYEAKKDKLLGI